MGQILHGCARTTEAVRRDIQDSEESIAELSRRLNVNPKTIAKWRSRKDEGVSDRSNRPHKTRTVLSVKDEAIIILFRQKTRLPLDDCLDALQSQIPHLTRSNLHRCLQRHGLSRLPKEEQISQEKKKFKSYPIGFMHVDITSFCFDKTKYYMFVGICRVSKYVYIEVFMHQTAENACLFLENLVQACPFRIHTILTDNGGQFTYTKTVLKSMAEKGRQTQHIFDIKCKQHGIRHRTTQPYRPQTNGQVERFNRTIKDATLKMYHYDSITQLMSHLNDFIIAYNAGKRLSAIKRNTPMQECIKHWKTNPKAFKINPNHQLMGLYS